MAEYLCAAESVRTGALTPVTVGRARALLTRLADGELRAVAARCPHQGADLGFGCLTGVVEPDGCGALRLARDGEVLRCPWHGFEFDLRSGEPLVAPPAGRRMRLRFLPVAERDGRVTTGDG